MAVLAPTRAAARVSAAELEQKEGVREDGGAGHGCRDDGKGDSLHRSGVTVNSKDIDCADKLRDAFKQQRQAHDVS